MIAGKSVAGIREDPASAYSTDSALHSSRYWEHVKDASGTRYRCRRTHLTRPVVDGPSGKGGNSKSVQYSPIRIRRLAEMVL